MPKTPLATVKLNEQRGKVVKITTASNSIYMIIPLPRSSERMIGGVSRIRGLSVTILKESGESIFYAGELEASNLVRVGHSWRFGDKGCTTEVASIEVLG